MDSSPAGLAAFALVLLWLAYWVPQQVERRQQLAYARSEDRFSGGLRVVSMATRGRERRMRQRPDEQRSALTGRPSAGPSTARASSDTSAVRESRLAVLEQRAARARRRLTLTMSLLVVTVAAWAVVAFGLVPWPVAAVPSGLLLAVLVLGRLAVLAARRSDARWRSERQVEERRRTQQRTLAHGGPYAPRNRARVTGMAVQPSDTATQMIPRVRPAERGPAGDGEHDAPDSGAPAVDPTARARSVAVPERAAESPSALDASPDTGARRVMAPAVGGETWEPVPVPLPTYVTKPSAPRPQPAVTVPQADGQSEAWAEDLARRAREAARRAAEAYEAAAVRDVPAETATAWHPTVRPSEAEALAAEEPRPRTETLGLPLEQILARRRAAG